MSDMESCVKCEASVAKVLTSDGYWVCLECSDALPRCQWCCELVLDPLRRLDNAMLCSKCTEYQKQASKK